MRNRLQRHKGRHRTRHKEVAELNITAFMNLMVILVPFLLITAVFSRMAVLELNLPESGTVAPPLEESLILTVTVRENGIEVGDSQGGIVKTIEGHDKQALDAMAATLLEIKRGNPETTEATILMTPDIAYDLLIQIMDRVRERASNDGRGGVDREALFPNISIGDAL